MMPYHYLGQTVAVGVSKSLEFNIWNAEIYCSKAKKAVLRFTCIKYLEVVHVSTHIFFINIYLH